MAQAVEGSNFELTPVCATTNRFDYTCVCESLSLHPCPSVPFRPSVHPSVRLSCFFTLLLLRSSFSRSTPSSHPSPCPSPYPHWMTTNASALPPRQLSHSAFPLRRGLLRPLRSPSPSSSSCRASPLATARALPPADGRRRRGNVAGSFLRCSLVMLLALS